MPISSRKNNGNNQNAAHKPPGAHSNGPPAPPSPYEVIQNEEIEVLQSIFMEDFEEIQTKSAWSKNSERSFKLITRASSNPELFVELKVTLTATYPKSVPLLILGDHASLRAKSLETIKNIISTKPKELLKSGEVMIHEIATSIQDVLEDAVESQAQDEQLPSLEEERVMREAAADQLARKEEEEEKARLINEKIEEDRIMQQMLDDEVQRREVTKKKQRPRQSDIKITGDVSGMHTVLFDQAITYQNETFRAVSINCKIGKGPITEVFAVSPVGHTEQSVASLILKRVLVQAGHQRVKKSILDVEDELEQLKTLPRHQNVINVLDFRIDGEKLQFDILLESANKGSLKDLLDMCTFLPVAKARSAAVEVLEALDFYRKHGIVHGRIHPTNVLLSHHSSGATTFKLGDGAFQAALYRMRDDKGESDSFTAWPAPESSNGTKSHKSDVWDFGTLLLQMLFGADITDKYASPTIFQNMASLSEPLHEVIKDIFISDSRKRPNAFSIATCEFLRTECLATAEAPVALNRPSSSHVPLARRISRHESTGASALLSRYESEWVESGRLGKGGGGEVFKARNRIDSRFYAIKKIKHKSPYELSQILSEVRLLANLNHPYVVRYYTAWKEDEEDVSTAVTVDNSEAAISTSPSATDDLKLSFGYGHSTGLDLYSGPHISFGDDDDDEEDEGDSGDDTDDEAPPETVPSKSIEIENGRNRRRKSSVREDRAFSPLQTPTQESIGLFHTRSSSRMLKSTLYIQMEFAEKKTLRDIIHKGVHDQTEELWGLFRQILEGLVHIHSNGIIHRDLKPENIFMDVANNPRIGDFGLATSGTLDRRKAETDAGDEIHTVAPEVRSAGGGQYTDKIDMYSLGIMFFEMCFPLDTGMERIRVLTRLREKQHTLPIEFSSSAKAVQGEIIESLIQHKPSDRPSSIELLRGGKIPVQVEDGAIREALQGLADSSSPYYRKMLGAIFSHSAGGQQLINDHMWDHAQQGQAPSEEYVLFQEVVQETLISIFRRHGAVESQRHGVFPRSDQYTNNNVFQLLDASGNHVQLPYDLTLPYSRALSRHGSAEKTFALGTVYRDALTGGAPRSNKEADFDIVSDNKEDLALKEAEVIKVLDEILDEIPSMADLPMVFHINHSILLECVLSFCRISQNKQAVAEILSKLNVQSWTWQKIRSELRSPALGVSSTSLDELAQFDFRDTPEKCQSKLQSLFGNNSLHLSKLRDVFAHIHQVVEYLRRLGVRRPIYVSPLSSFNEHFYKGGLMFQCLFDTKRRDVLAAGGRYDSLIEEHRARLPDQQGKTRLHAVGFNLGWDRLIASLVRYKKKAGGSNTFLKKTNDESELRGKWAPKRCDVLIASFDSSLLRSIGPKILAELWSQDISAELAVDTSSPEELLAHYRNEQHSWIVIIKHEASQAGKPDLKIKNMDRDKKEDNDIRSSELTSYLRAELRERDQRDGMLSNDRTKYVRQQGISTQATKSLATTSAEKKDNVHVLISSYKSKKSNKWRVIEAAHLRSRTLLESFADAPIASIETRDEILDMIRGTKMSDPDSWRTLIQAVPLSEREYAQDILALIEKLKIQYGDTSRVCFLHNYRTGYCVLYDMFL